MSVPTMLLIALGIAAVLSLGFYLYFFFAFANGDARKVNVSSYGYSEAATAGILVFFFLLMMVSTGHSEKITLPLILLSSAVYAGICILLLGVNISANNNPVALYGLKYFSPFPALAWLIALLPLIYFIQNISVRLFIDTHPAPQSLITFLADHHDPSTLFLVALSVVLIAPVMEELIFRGFLYGVFARYFGRWAAMMVSALLFAGIHNHLPSFAPLFILAVCLTIAYERTGSLWTSILMHAGFNAFSFSMVLWFPEMAK